MVNDKVWIIFNRSSGDTVGVYRSKESMINEINYYSNLCYPNSYYWEEHELKD